MPPAASNESQGLKIAVAAFVSLTVILAVTSYFLYSGYDKEFVRAEAASKKAQEADKSARDRLDEYNQVKQLAGYTAIDDFEAFKVAAKKDTDALTASLNDVAREVNDAVAKAQAGKENNPKFEELRGEVARIVAQWNQEPNQSYKDGLIRLKELLRNQALLTTNLALNDVELRRDLEAAQKIASDRLGVETAALQKAKADLEAEHVEHEKQRGDLNAKVDEYQTKIATLSTEVATLRTNIDQLNESFGKRINQLLAQNRQITEMSDKSEVVLDRPDGKITFIDFARNEAHVNITRSMGAKAQMQFSVFDRNAAGIPTDKPKGVIELIAVNDNDSIARIVKTINSSDPLRTNDLIHSIAFNADDPQRFALLGKIDINRDGKDDRADLIKLIEQAGGVVVYDLPPPFADTVPGKSAVARAYAKQNLPPPPAEGRSVGELNARVSYYIEDTRPPYYQRNRDEIPTAEEQAFNKQVSEAKRVARDNGVRPLQIEKLLSMMGFEAFGPKAPRGETEYLNKSAVQQILKPKNRAVTPTPPAPDAATPK